LALRWYVLHVYSGFEKKVAASIREQADKQGISDQIEDAIVPAQEVFHLRRGQKVKSESKFFPSYVLVKMEMTDHAWNLVKNTAKVTGFLGAGKRPTPISETEAKRIVEQMREGVDRPVPTVVYELGERVQVCDGPFASFNGLVEEVDVERARLKVSVSIFGRATPVDLEYSQVQKVA